MSADIETIASKAAAVFGCTLDDLKKKNNVSRIVNARNAVYYILHYEYGVSLNELCEMFGRTNREVCYRIKKLREKHEKDKAFRLRCDSIKKKIETSLSHE